MLLAAMLWLAAPPVVVDWRLQAAAADPVVAELLGYDAERLPVWVELETESMQIWRNLRKAGLRGGVESQPLIGPFSSGWVAPSDLGRLAAVPGLVRLETYTPAQVHAPLYATNEHLRSRRSANLYSPDRALFGQGIRVANIDVGLDFFHPAFFQPGEPINFVDVDQSGDLTPGDGIDLNQNGAIDDDEHLKVLQSKIHDWREGLIEGSELEQLEPDLDWLYIDQNANGRRDFGGESLTLGEQTPGFGEPVFSILDRDGDGQFSTKDQLRPLGASRVASYRHGHRSYHRHVDLTSAPHGNDLHGTGVWGILAAGPVGHRFAGIAPKATILHFHRNQFNLVDSVHFAIAEKADLVLHEYGAWVHQTGDGSSIVERLVGHSQALGVPHVLPAGNLASSKRSAKLTIPAGETKRLTLFLPARQIEVLYGSMIWTGPGDLELYLEPRGGAEARVPGDAVRSQVFDQDGRFIVGEQRTNARGTRKLDWVLWGWQNRLRQLPNRAWAVRVVNPSDQPIDLLLRIADNKTSWIGGAHFRGEGFSTKISSATWPSTATGNAEHGISVFAFTGRAERAGGADSEATGDLRSYSGHGPRIDGRALVGVAAPDNPSTTWPASADEVGPAGYGSFNGTSGAGPHVAGALALMVQAGWRAEDAVNELVQSAQRDEQVEAGPEQAWGGGKIRLDRALSRPLEPLLESFTPPQIDEPGPFALISPPESGWQRLRLSSDRSWLDWRSTPVFLEGASAPVQVEWVSDEGRRGRYLVELTTPNQASPSQNLPAPLGQAVATEAPGRSLADFKRPQRALLGASPAASSCQHIAPSLWLGLALLGLRRRR